MGKRAREEVRRLYGSSAGVGDAIKQQDAEWRRKLKAQNEETPVVRIPG